MGNAKNSKGKKNISDIIIAIVVIAIIVAFFGYVIKLFIGFINNDGNNTTTENVKVTELDKLLNRNLDNKYPDTPEKLAELYCSITKELHGKEITEEQITKLHSQLRQLFAKELLDNNDYDKHLNKLMLEVEKYQENDMMISRYVVADDDDIKIYEDENGNDCTKVPICYSIKKGSEWLKSNEQLIMRKDEDGRWKILGNEPLTVTESDEDEE